jgi:ribokinase
LESDVRVRQRRIFVFGSLNVDLVQRIARLPVLGETMEGSGLQMFAGGKGANQACAAARLGGRVAMAGKVGDDVFGSRLISELQAEQVDTSRVRRSSHPTGAAMILLLPQGENVIVISPGANSDVTPEAALDAVEEGEAEDILLCQLETPIDANRAVLRAARMRGMVTLLDPAPAHPLSNDLLESVSVLTPNQTEASSVLGASDMTIESMSAARELAKTLLGRGPEAVIIKMGALGCLVARAREFIEIPGHRVKVADTTGAGDTFNGALAVALSEGKELVDAAQFANAAAALSVGQPGAMSSTPTRSALTKFLDEVSITSDGGWHRTYVHSE